MRKVGVVFYVLAAVSIASAFLSAVVGLAWIEELIGARPDGGSGSLELLLVLIPAVAALPLAASGYALRRHTG